MHIQLMTSSRRKFADGHDTIPEHQPIFCIVIDHIITVVVPVDWTRSCTYRKLKEGFIVATQCLSRFLGEEPERDWSNLDTSGSLVAAHMLQLCVHVWSGAAKPGNRRRQIDVAEDPRTTVSQRAALHQRRGGRESRSRPDTK